MRLTGTLTDLRRDELALAALLDDVAARHQDEPEVRDLAPLLADWSRAHAGALEPVVERYGARPEREPQAPARGAGVPVQPVDAVAHLLRDMRDVFTATEGVLTDWSLVDEAAKNLHDTELSTLAEHCRTQTERQQKWARSTLAQAGAQALTTGP